MSQPHQVIMYRNPAEYAIWNSMDSAIMFPIMVAAVVGCSVVVLGYKVSKYLPSINRNSRPNKTDALAKLRYDIRLHVVTRWPLYAGALAAAAVLKRMVL